MLYSSACVNKCVHTVYYHTDEGFSRKKRHSFAESYNFNSNVDPQSLKWLPNGTLLGTNEGNHGQNHQPNGGLFTPTLC